MSDGWRRVVGGLAAVIIVSVGLAAASVSAMPEIPGLGGGGGDTAAEENGQPASDGAGESGGSGAGGGLAEVASGLESPKSTLRTFVEAMAGPDPDIEKALRCLNLSGVPDEAGPEIASRLYKVINRIEWIEFERDPLLPDREMVRADGLAQWQFYPRDVLQRPTELWSEYMDRIARAETLGEAIPGATITLARGEDGRWRFSRETVQNVGEIWEAIRDLPPVSAFTGTEHLTISERLENQWPAYFIQHRALGIKYWQWLSLFAIILLGFVLDLSVRLLLTVISRQIIRRRGGKAEPASIRKTVRPFGLAAAALLWFYTIGLLGLPPAALAVLLPAVRLFWMLALVWAAFRVTDLLAEVAISRAERTTSRFDDLLIPLVRKAVKVFIFVFGLIYIADSLDVPIAPLLTGLGIGGAGFAFAAKDTLEHFFGSVTVIADQPFQVGDWVVIGDTEGVVEEVGLRSTRVRTFYNSVVTIPNGNLVRATVDNYGKRKYRRWSTHVNITYDTDPEAIESFCEGIRELIRLHPYTRKDYYQVWLHQFGPHSLDILLYVFWQAPDWQTELRERHRLMTDIIRLADRLGVEFAFPTQTLHVYQEEAGKAHEPDEPPAKHADETAMRGGRDAARTITEQAAWREHKPGPYRFLYAGETRRADEEGVATPKGRSRTRDGDDGETQIENKTGGDAG